MNYSYWPKCWIVSRCMTALERLPFRMLNYCRTTVFETQYRTTISRYGCPKTRFECMLWSTDENRQANNCQTFKRSVLCLSPCRRWKNSSPFPFFRIGRLMEFLYFWALVGWSRSQSAYDKRMTENLLVLPMQYFYEMYTRSIRVYHVVSKYR